MLLCFFVIFMIVFYLLCLKPNSRRKEEMKPFESTYIAHRGLFDDAYDAPENSMAAFRRAVEAGYGIELDVRLTKDSRLVVFHDITMRRMCGVKKRVEQCDFAELQKYSLLNSEERIPLLDDVLTLVQGQVPLIIEIKPEGDCVATARTLADRMKRYEGSYCVESFHPLVVAWYRFWMPEVIRGQLSDVHKKKNVDKPWIGRFVLTNLLFNGCTKPDFIAYNHKYANQFSFRLCRKLFHVESAAWTIRNEKELKRAKKHFQIFIFDGFLP